MVTNLHPWEVIEFSWALAVRRRKGDWELVVLRHSGQVIDVSNVNVELHENGIEFLS